MALLSIFKHAIMISFFVFVMMLLVDFVDTISKKRISDILKGGRWRQYTLASLFGSTPGCLGAFMNVSLYVHGLISFGAIVGGMIATSGDEAFVMLVQFPGTALVLFGLLFVSVFPSYVDCCFHASRIYRNYRPFHMGLETVYIHAFLAGFTIHNRYYFRALHTLPHLGSHH